MNFLSRIVPVLSFGLYVSSSLEKNEQADNRRVGTSNNGNNFFFIGSTYTNYSLPLF